MIRSACDSAVDDRARKVPRPATACVRTITSHASRMPRSQSAKADFVLLQARVSNPGSHGGGVHHVACGAIAGSHLTGAHVVASHVIVASHRAIPGLV